MAKKSYKYENIQIGNFLISIGYYLRDFNYIHPISINLHQQTPNDFTVGDLFGALAGKFFIIEFKNSKVNLKEELTKRQRIRLINELTNNPSELVNISANAHFICYPVFTQKLMTFNLTPYLTISSDKFNHLKINSIKEFITKTINENTIGVEFKEIKKYIELLKKCSTKEGNKNPDGVSSGIFLNFDEKKGITYYPFDDLHFLNQKIRLEKEIIREVSRSIEKDKKTEYKSGLGFRR